jgi:hypothetical protein
MSGSRRDTARIEPSASTGRSAAPCARPAGTGCSLRQRRGLRIWPERAQRRRSACSGSGSPSSGSRSVALSGPASFAQRDDRLLAHEAALVARAARSSVATRGARSRPGLERGPRARSPGIAREGDEGGRGLGIAQQPSVSAARMRTASSALLRPAAAAAPPAPRPCARGAMALSWISSLSSPSSSKSSIAASSSPRRPMAAAPPLALPARGRG